MSQVLGPEVGPLVGVEVGPEVGPLVGVEVGPLVGEEVLQVGVVKANVGVAPPAKMNPAPLKGYYFIKNDYITRKII